VRPVSMTIGWVAVWAPRTPIEFLDWMGRRTLDVHMGRPITSADSCSGVPRQPRSRFEQYRCVPRTKEGDDVEVRHKPIDAVPEMGEGPPGSPCRGRSQTTASCAGQEPGWRALRTRRTLSASGEDQEGERERTADDVSRALTDIETRSE